MESFYPIFFIIGIIVIIGIFQSVRNYIKDYDRIFKDNSEQRSEIKQLNSVIQELNSEIHSYKSEIKRKIISHKDETHRLSNRISQLEQGFKIKDDFFKSLTNKTNESVNKISSLYSDLLLVQYSISEEYLKTKKHPAYEEAKRIKELKKDTKIHIERYRQMVYIYESLLQLFPELSNYVEDFETIQLLENSKSLENFVEDFDKVQHYLNNDEYQKLSEKERNQLALDRYISGQKTKWQIGRDYELFCGLEYEKENWNVEYIGMEKKLEDMGRDLIAIKGNETHIIQCKYWSQNKVIHEKHIAQLFGTTIAYKIEKGELWDVKPVFITNIELSKKATEFAKLLNVIVVKKDLGNFPRIKCNFGKDEYGYKTQIYHLPFDQQYDKIKMNGKGNFYTYNVAEAMDKGFRRAFRYYGQ